MAKVVRLVTPLEPALIADVQRRIPDICTTIMQVPGYGETATPHERAQNSKFVDWYYTQMFELHSRRLLVEIMRSNQLDWKTHPAYFHAVLFTLTQRGVLTD